MKSRKYPRSHIDYSQLGKTANALHKKWNQVVSNPIENESDDKPSFFNNSKPIDSSSLDPYSDIFYSNRIKAIVDQKLEQAMFEKVCFKKY